MRVSRRRGYLDVSEHEAERDSGASRCELCGRRVGSVTRHHLRPREHGGRETALLCGGCHRQVHAFFTNKTLAAEFDSLEKLRGAPEVQAYLRWARRQPDGRIRVRRARRRR